MRFLRTSAIFLFKKHHGGGLGGRDRFLIFNEVAEMRIFFFADRRLERDRLLRDLDDLADLLGRETHLVRDLFDRRIAAEFLQQLPRDLDQPVDRLDHVKPECESCAPGRRAQRVIA